NALLGNGPEAATLEFTLLGGTYRAEMPLALALAGASFSAVVASYDGPKQGFKIPQAFTLEAGDELHLGGTPGGARVYPAVRDGRQAPGIWGRRREEPPVRAGDGVPASPSRTSSRRPLDSVLPDPENGPIRILDGPDASAYPPIDWHCLDYHVEARHD